MSQDLQQFAATVTALFLEASPFLLMGALLSSVFEVYLPPDRLQKFIPKSYLLGLLFGLIAGMAIPTCECGVVSIVRRLLRKGVPPHVAMTYMLSAPVINPLTLAATYIAFRGNLGMTLGRVGIVSACACCVGLILARINPILLLRDDKTYMDLINHGPADCWPPDVGHIHHATPDPTCGCGCSCDIPEGSKLTQVFVHTASEFLDMGKYLILGAFAVGIFKIWLSQEWLVPFENNLFLAVGIMMLLAFFLSICSQADAFVAASFASFPHAAQLAFVTLGPMVDLKLVTMYAGVFRRRIAAVLIIVPTVLIYLLSLLAGVLLR